MNHWNRQLKDFVKEKCKGMLTISKRYAVEWSLDKKNWTENLITAYNEQPDWYASIRETLKPGTTYYVRVAAESESGEKGAFSEPVEMCTAPDAVTNAAAKDQDDFGVTITWTASAGADAYAVRFGQNLGDGAIAKTEPVIVTEPVYKHSFGSYNETNCTFEIRPIRYTTVNGQKKAWENALSESVQVALIPRAPQNIVVKSQNYKKKETVFTFDSTLAKKIANDYQIEILDAKGKVIAKGNSYHYQSTSKVTVKSDKLFNQPFQYRMRSARQHQSDDKPVYGSWSEPVTYTPSAVCKKLSRAGKNAKSGTLQIAKVSGASSYTVYHSTNGKSWKAIVKNTKKTKIKVKCTPKKKNYYYVRVNKAKFGKQKVSGVEPKLASAVYKF